MPLVKGSKGAASGETSAPHQAALDSPDAESRWTAARALAGQADAVPALAAALGREPTPRVREAMMTALIRIGNAASIEVILPYLRSQDAGLRAAAIEALQALPDAIAPFMAPLLSDERFRCAPARDRTGAQHGGSRSHPPAMRIDRA